MDLYDEGFKLQEMIDSDIRSLREFGEIFANDLACSPGGSHLESMTPGLTMDGFDSLDSELSNHGKNSWMDGSMYSLGADFDSIGGLLVNPQTAMPVSDSIMICSPSMVSSSISDSPDVTDNSEANESAAHDSSPSITVSLPIQIINSNSLPDEAEMPSHIKVMIDVPTPSPVSHNSTPPVQQVLTLHEADVNENNENAAPKPKSKNKTSKSNQQISNENAYPKPAYSYSCLIAMALKNSKTGSLPVNEIYDFMTENFPYFKTAPNGWKNSVRHNLSLNKCFEKIEKPSGNSAQRKGYLWAMNPAKVEKMEEELQKWGSKDPAAIRKSMANPERLELIEKGELKNTDSESDVESMNVSQTECEPTEIKIEKDSVKTQTSSIGNDLLNNDFSSISDSCLPELDLQFSLQKNLWEDLCGDRLTFLSESPINSMSPKNSENMDDDSSLDSAPSSQQSYIQVNHAIKCAQRASSTSNKLTHSSLTSGAEGTTCDA